MFARPVSPHVTEQASLSETRPASSRPQRPRLTLDARLGKVHSDIGALCELAFHGSDPYPAQWRVRPRLGLVQLLDFCAEFSQSDLVGGALVLDGGGRFVTDD